MTEYQIIEVGTLGIISHYEIEHKEKEDAEWKIATITWRYSEKSEVVKFYHIDDYEMNLAKFKESEIVRESLKDIEITRKVISAD